MIRRVARWKMLGGALSGLAAVVSAFSGLYLAFREHPKPTDEPPTASLSTPVEHDTAHGSIYTRTPWLGVAVLHDGHAIKLLSNNGSWSRFEARLAPGPFDITISRNADDPPIGILAWHDDSIFECVRGEEFHIPGTGIAGAEFALPILYLDQEGFNYYPTERLEQIADRKYAVSLSMIGLGGVDLPIGKFAGSLFLVVFKVPEGVGRVVAKNDFELITLHRR